jgi:DNA-binding response OmpR family regulator
MKSILIIESDAMVRRFLRAALQASNYSVVEAEIDARAFKLLHGKISAPSCSIAWEPRREA